MQRVVSVLVMQNVYLTVVPIILVLLYVFLMEFLHLTQMDVIVQGMEIVVLTFVLQTSVLLHKL